MPYRAVVKHVRYWRGKIHRWTTVYPFIGTPNRDLNSSDCTTVLTADDALCFPGGAGNGGTYGCDIYNQATGGTPIASVVRFDWETPASWIGYSGSAWHDPTVYDAGIDAAAETCLDLRWSAGLSKTGKPVFLRKFIHAVPAVGNDGAGTQIQPADVTALVAHANLMKGMLGDEGLVLGSFTGRFAGTATLSGYLGSHQMPQGRRRKILSKSQQSAALRALIDHSFDVAHE